MDAYSSAEVPATRDRLATCNSNAFEEAPCTTLSSRKLLRNVTKVDSRWIAAVSWSTQTSG